MLFVEQVDGKAGEAQTNPGFVPGEDAGLPEGTATMEYDTGSPRLNVRPMSARSFRRTAATVGNVLTGKDFLFGFLT